MVLSTSILGIILLLTGKEAPETNGFKIIGKRFRSAESKDFFFNRIVNVWNSLPEQVVNSNTIENVKTRLDKYLISNPNINYFALDNFLFCFVLFCFVA